MSSNIQTPKIPVYSPKFTLKELQTITQFFKHEDDFATFLLVSKKCYQTIITFSYNPISSPKFFENCKTQFLYHRWDKIIPKKDKYVIFYPMTLKEKETFLKKYADSENNQNYKKCVNDKNGKNVIQKDENAEKIKSSQIEIKHHKKRNEKVGKNEKIMKENVKENVEKMDKIDNEDKNGKTIKIVGKQNYEEFVNQMKLKTQMKSHLTNDGKKKDLNDKITALLYSNDKNVVSQTNEKKETKRQSEKDGNEKIETNNVNDLNNVNETNQINEINEKNEINQLLQINQLNKNVEIIQPIETIETLEITKTIEIDDIEKEMNDENNQKKETIEMKEFNEENETIQTVKEKENIEIIENEESKEMKEIKEIGNLENIINQPNITIESLIQKQTIEQTEQMKNELIHFNQIKQLAQSNNPEDMKIFEKSFPPLIKRISSHQNQNNNNNNFNPNENVLKINQFSPQQTNTTNTTIQPIQTNFITLNNLNIVNMNHVIQQNTQQSIPSFQNIQNIVPIQQNNQLNQQPNFRNIKLIDSRFHGKDIIFPNIQNTSQQPNATSLKHVNSTQMMNNQIAQVLIPETQQRILPRNLQSILKNQINYINGINDLNKTGVSNPTKFTNHINPTIIQKNKAMNKNPKITSKRKVQQTTNNTNNLQSSQQKDTVNTDKQETDLVQIGALLKNTTHQTNKTQREKFIFKKLHFSKEDYDDEIKNNLSGTIRIPTCVKYIDDECFANCAKLKRIQIPSSVTSIGYSAFRKCSNLVKVEMSSHLISLGSHCFGHCISLESIQLPSTVTYIGENSFYCCVSLTSVVLPPLLTTIGKSSFYLCTSLVDINWNEHMQKEKQKYFTISLPYYDNSFK